ncbi:MAG: ferrous iron transport protein B [Pirellulales bacterium]|nr:ferrous iron transport protein B [Pirellulales bacterium]
MVPSTQTTTVALIGNPNVGKSTLFNSLCGVRQRVGNYPGVTVEKKIGRWVADRRVIDLIDLPGTYSLAPRSPDEMVAVDVLLGRRSDTARVDAVICIVDASNLERNLYLVSQVRELGLPTVVALNMIDVAQARGLKVDVARLERQLGVPVVAVQAHRRTGLDILRRRLVESLGASMPAPASPFPPAFQAEIEHLGSLVNNGHPATSLLPRYLIERLLLDTAGYLETELEHSAARSSQLHSELLLARERLKAAGMPVPAVEAMSRYGWVANVLDGVVERPATRAATASDRLDRILTHRVFGTLVFVALMVVMFQAVFRWAGPAMDGIDVLQSTLAGAVEAALPAGALRSLLVDGLIGGVGSVLVFLPQILVLFLFIAVLEDCGYMARAAYLMDRLMVHVGLSGKSFIPLLSSFACAIPGIMAARVIENRRDRLVTILVAPLMSCSARLPVYTLMTAAFVPAQTFLGGWLGLQGLTMTAMYLLGIVAAVLVALVLRRTILRGPTPAFVMELPAYQWPSPRNVLYRMAERGWAFIRRAGTLIVAVSVVVWALLYFPQRSDELAARWAPQRQAIEQRLADAGADDALRETAEQELRQIDNHLASLQTEQSLLGRLGHALEPFVRPLGWDWKIGCAVLASFPAREVVVATLGILYDLGAEVDVDEDAGRTQLETALRAARWRDTGRPVFNTPVALSIMVFFALCAQCASTLVVMRRETNHWGWPAFTFFYMTTLAYVAALVTYQVGMRLSS